MKDSPTFQKDTTSLASRDISYLAPMVHRKPSSAHETRNSVAYSKPSKIPKHSGPASQPLPEQSTMQLVRKVARVCLFGESVVLAVARRTPERCIVHTERSHVLLAETAAGVNCARI